MRDEEKRKSAIYVVFGCYGIARGMRSQRGERKAMHDSRGHSICSSLGMGAKRRLTGCSAAVKVKLG